MGSLSNLMAFVRSRDTQQKSRDHLSTAVAQSIRSSFPPGPNTKSQVLCAHAHSRTGFRAKNSRVPTVQSRISTQIARTVVLV